MSLNVRVITPDKTVWDAVVDEVILPSTTGQLGILTGHAPLLTALDVGVMRVRPGKEWKAIAVMGGFAEVEDNVVKVLVNGAELGEKIDQQTAKTEFEQSQQTLASTSADNRQASIQATQAVKRTRARYQAAGGMVQL